MRHHSKTKKFGRVRSQRKALLSSLSESLILRERITTSLAKAKALRPHVEKLITRARTGDQASSRVIKSKLRNKEACEKLLGDLAKRFKERPGGYTRIIKMGQRESDGSPMAIIELVK